MRRRRLSPEEHELWRQVARTVTPLDDARTPPPLPAPTPAEPAAPTPPAPAAAKPASTPSGGSPASHGTLDHRTAQRLRRGRVPIDARFDLHGHTQSSAHAALLRFIERSRAADCRHVLVVTGRGADGGGVLKRSVPRWLMEPAFQRHVVAFHEAGPRHGGAGALYVALRRRRG